MPRPTSVRGGVAASKASSGNFISRWFAGRKERKQAAEEEAATIIINDAAKNEGTFITMLQQIRFNESKLPKEALEYRSNAKQRYGDLEYCARWLEQEIARNTSPVCMDIRPLDQKLYLIVARFKEAIELGYKETAFAARAALLNVFPKIRFRLPQVLPAGTENDYARTYVERVSEHVETWLNLLTQAMDSDKTAEALANVEADLKKEENIHEARLDAFEKMLTEDNQKLADYMAIQNATAGAALTPTQKKLKDDMIEMHVQTAVFTVYQKQAEQLKHQCSIYSGHIKALKAAVDSLVIPTDPDALNKYKDEIQKMQRTMAARDQEIEEGLKDFDELRGAMESMEDLPGAVQARQAAAESAMKIIEEVKQRQEQRLKQPASGQLLMELFGLKTEEELAELERQQQQVLNESMVLIEEEEGQLNYNS